MPALRLGSESLMPSSGCTDLDYALPRKGRSPVAFETMTDEELAIRIASLRTEANDVVTFGNERAATRTPAGYSDGTIANDRALALYEEIKAMNFELQWRERRGSSSGGPPSRAATRPTTWDELQTYLEATYPLDHDHSMWPSIKFSVDDGRSQWVVIRPRGAPERGRVELITAFAKYSPEAADRILTKVYDLAFGGVVKIGDRLYFRDTFRLGKLDMEEFHDLVGFVAGIGDLLELEHGEGDEF